MVEVTQKCGAVEGSAYRAPLLARAKAAAVQYQLADALPRRFTASDRIQNDADRVQPRPDRAPAADPAEAAADGAGCR